MPQLDLERQSKALIAFQRSLGHDITTLRWPHSANMVEPVEHRTWRRYAEVVFRLGLLEESGLADGLGSFTAVAHEAETRERIAWAAWRKRKAELEMDLLSGKRKTLPWGC
jgi:hypothetical protein